MAADTPADLQARIGYHFDDPKLLERALRHRSAGAPDNERLEFLGDAILDAIVSDRLYRDHTEATEGALTTARASLVRGQTLASVAKRWQLADALVLGRGERGSGAVRASILAGAVEAVIGAVFLDGGFSRARDVVLALLDADLAAVQPGEPQKDAKTRLQELTQARQLGLPVYTTLATSGPAHSRRFQVSCEVEGWGSGEGEAGSRREAEQRAASALLQRLPDPADQHAGPGEEQR